MRGLAALSGPILFIVLATCCGPARATSVQAAAPDSEAEVELLKQPIALDPARAWSWLAAHEAARPDRRDDLQALQRGLFEFYLRQAAGETWPRETSLQGTIELGRGMRSVDSDRTSHQRYDSALQRLQPRWPTAPTPLPGELESIGDRFEPLAPGLWLGRWGDGRARNLVWSFEVQNTAAVPLAPTHLEIHWTPERSAPLRLRCPPAREAPPVLQPSARWTLVCRGEPIVDERRSGGAELAQALATGGPAGARWVSFDLQRQGGDRTMLRLLAAQAPDLTQDYARTFEPCDRRGRCAAEAGRSPAGADVRADARAERRRATPAARRSEQAEPSASGPSRRQAWLGVAGLIAAFMLFCAVSRWLDDRRAAIGFMCVLTPLALCFGHGQGTASVLLMPAAVFVALLAVLGLMAAYRGYDELVFSRFDALRRERSLRRGGAAPLRRPGRRAG